MPRHPSLAIPVSEQGPVLVAGEVIQALWLRAVEQIGVLWIGLARLLKHAVEDLALAVEPGVCGHPSHGVFQRRYRLELGP